MSDEAYPLFDGLISLEDDERVEIVAAPGFSILLRLHGGGEEVDVAMYPKQAEELLLALTEAISVARTGTEN